MSDEKTSVTITIATKLEKFNEGENNPFETINKKITLTGQKAIDYLNGKVVDLDAID